jgi:hypothetical protein
MWPVDPTAVGSWSTEVFIVLAGMVFVPAAIVLGLALLVNAAYAAAHADEGGAD